MSDKTPARKRGNRVRYSRFRQAVRRHAPSDLIPVIANAASKQTDMGDVEQFAKGIPPWAYAAMARDCLIFSDERRKKAVDERALRYMRNLYMEAYEGPQSDRPTLFSLVVGHLYEQTWYQTSVEHDLARTYLLLTAAIPGGQHAHPGESDWEELLGAPLREAIAASFILYAGTMGAGGRFDPDQLDDHSYQEISELAKINDTRAVMRSLTTTVADAREAGRRGPQLPGSLQRFSYNPLVRTPLVDLGGRVSLRPAAPIHSSRHVH